MSDDEIWKLTRGGHDPHKVYAAYKAAVEHKGQPTVILAKTIKGYGMGEAGEGAEHHAPAEEDGQRRSSSSSATASACRFTDEQIAGHAVPNSSTRAARK